MAAGVAVFSLLLALFTDDSLWWLVFIVAAFCWLLGDHKKP